MLQKVIKVVAQNHLRQLLPGQDGEPMSGRSFKEIDDPQLAQGCRVTGTISIDSIVRRFLCRVHMNDTHKNLLLYITKCIAAVSFIYVLSDLFHYPDIGWCLVSAVMVLSPSAQDALPVARTRIAANLVGSKRSSPTLTSGSPTVSSKARTPRSS